MARFDLAGNPLPDTPDTPAAPRPEARLSPPRPAALPDNAAPPPAATPLREAPFPAPPVAAAPPPVAGMPGEASDSAPMRYDLAGDPLPGLPSAHSPSSSGADGVWPPPPSGGDPGAYSGPNDSGQKANYPPEIAAFKWNWGPWLLSWVWCFGMKMPAWGAAYLGLIVISLVPFVGFIASPITLALTVYLCLSGHKLAWQNRHFAGGLPEYIAVQRAWLKWGIGVFVIGVLLVPALLFPVFMKARMKARMQSGYYSQPNGGGNFAPPPNGGP